MILSFDREQTLNLTFTIGHGFSLHFAFQLILSGADRWTILAVLLPPNPECRLLQ